jgi:NADH-quinone oxidoreductase subunit G
MPEILLDGKKIQAESGKTIIEAAYNNGMQIPHFCWHPELSVAGNCRMCLVEVGMPRRNPDGTFETNEDGSAKIGYFPKLQIACSTPVAEGMVVHSKNEKAVEAQEAVMEFLLINHPLDCPICDEAGECKLQEYAFQHSKGESRFTETKNHKDKRQSWGPNVMFDAERCISCSRCIRYAKEVAKQDVLTFVQRGDHVTIKLFDDTRFDNHTP